MSEMITVNIVGTKSENVQVIKSGTTLYELSQRNKHMYENPILIANVNNELRELNVTLTKDCDVEFLDFKNSQGFRVYQRSVSFLMIYATKMVLGEKTRIIIKHSINKNYYCEIIQNNQLLTGEKLEKRLIDIENRMRESVEKNLLIEKHSISVSEGLQLAERFGLCDKIRMLRYRRTSNVNFYKLDWFYDYFYGQMAYNTESIPDFQIKPDDDGFMLCFPSSKQIKANKSGNSNELASDGSEGMDHVSNNYKKITSVFKESSKWARILKADTVGALDDIIAHGKYGEFIRTNEALHEKRIAQIADKIDQKNKRVILIAGPSSSGKTTFAERLSIQLRVNGLRPHIISLDNYYLNREDIPIDSYGKPNFEALEAIDVKLINSNLLSLLEGKTTEIPTFNFFTGSREYNGKKLTLNKDDVLVVEGIHGLNDKLTDEIPDKWKFKIFISALTQLNIDDHNRIPTTDTRLIRRLVRDSQFRGFNALQTLSIWPSVLRGEEEYIFPFQEQADAFFNSALVYEMCILKQYVEPLLFSIDKSKPQYAEARRLVKFLDCFLGIPCEEVPRNSILREFIGGSCFKT